MIQKQLFILLVLFAIVQSCTPRLESWYLSQADVERIPKSFDQPLSRSAQRGPCFDALNYVPDTNYLDHTPIKNIRINFHWVNAADSSKNYVGRKAINFTKGILKATNYDLTNNHPMWLPHNNKTDCPPIQYRYVLSPRPDDPKDDGIYFHFDDSLCYYIHKGKNRNLFKRDVIKKYGVQLDTVLNIFVMPHHPDSIASPTYLAVGVGVALGNSVKVAGMFENKGDFWGYRGVFNHEIGHIFGLAHTWAYNDGCDDTPKHKNNCWNRNQKPGCDTLTSNNVMDYNAMQHAWTPCQIGKVHLKMSTETARPRRYVEPNWCTLNEDRHIIIRDTIDWNCMKDLEGHLTIEDGGTLTMRCRISLPKGAKITVHPGGTLILDNCRLHNACGDKWEGIELQKEGNRKGKVVYIGEPNIEDVEHAVIEG